MVDPRVVAEVAYLLLKGLDHDNDRLMAGGLSQSGGLSCADIEFVRPPRIEFAT